MTRGQLVPVQPYRIPRGRTAAEKRLAAVAALHQPFLNDDPLAQLTGRSVVCTECDGRRWPCPTAKLLGDWPGEDVAS